ncbi:hypothetical protein [Helicobacter macacae]|nr:hypothetical protein [Helicobacter macacae]
MTNRLPRVAYAILAMNMWRIASVVASVLPSKARFRNLKEPPLHKNP